MEVFNKEIYFFFFILDLDSTIFDHIIPIYNIMCYVTPFLNDFFFEMSAPQQPNNPNQPNSQPSQPNNPNQSTSPVRIKKNSKSLFFLFLIMMAVVYVVFIHANTHHTTDSPTQTTTMKALSNITTTAVSPPQNVLEYNFSLTNSLSTNIVTDKNGTVYIQFSGFFNEFPGLPSQTISGNITILYVTITVYNGTSSKSVTLPLTIQLKYNGEKYFLYQVEGNIPQLRELALTLVQGEVVQFQFYTQSGEIEGYTVW